MYTPEQLVALKLRCNALDRSGHPEHVARIQYGITQEEDFEDLLLIGAAPTTPPAVRPETGIDPNQITPPPRAGTGATAAAWREFAAKVTTIDPETLESFSRADIIGILEDREVIPYQEV